MKKKIREMEINRLRSEADRCAELRAYITHLNSVIGTAEYCKNSYFWGGCNGNQTQRDSRARNYAAPAELLDFGGDEWEIDYNFTQSRQNTYASGHYYRNDNKTTLTAVRNLVIAINSVLESETTDNVDTKNLPIIMGL